MRVSAAAGGLLLSTKSKNEEMIKVSLVQEACAKWSAVHILKIFANRMKKQKTSKC